MFNMMEESDKDPSLRDRMADPYSLYPEGLAPGEDGPDQTGAVFDKDFAQWTSPFIMAAINTRVVRRSNALLGLPWGADFRYDEAILNSSRTQATMVGLASGFGMLIMALKPTRKVAQKLLPKPGEGPSRETRENGYYEIYFHGVHPEDRNRDMRIKVSGTLDPGYGSTSRMLAEAAVSLAKDSSTTGGGFWTPASALGQPYLDRLQNKAGLSFEQVDF